MQDDQNVMRIGSKQPIFIGLAVIVVLGFIGASAWAKWTAKINLPLIKSPEKIAFIDKNNNLWLMSPNGSQLQEWFMFVDAAAISPDGTQIAVITRSAHGAILILHVDGSNGRFIQPSTFSSFFPKDMSGNPAAVLTLHWIDNQRLLLKGSISIDSYAICISSKGKVFPNLSGKNNISDISSKNQLAKTIGGDIFASHSDGSNNTNITRGVQGGGYFPRWSPNGSLLAFANGGDLWAVSANGTHPKKLANVVNSPYVWSPDARKIATSYGEMFIVDVNSRTKRDIGVYGKPIWWGVLKGLGNKKGKIKLTSTPSGARVLMNGRPTGQATPAVIEALPGPNRVQMSYDSKWTNNDVWVKSGQTSTLNAKF
ncbi:MAG: PEGA domain-containing protein [Abditibacteriaceae bacterium]